MNAIFDRLKQSKGPVPCLFYPAAKKLGISIAELLTNAEKQAQVLVGLSQEYPVGAVVRMTELWCEAAAFGMTCEFPEDFPRLGEPLCQDPEELAEIVIPDAVNPVTEPLIEAVRLAAPQMDKPLVVGVTGPYTLASVLNGSEDFMCNCMTEPELCQQFLDRLTEFLIAYILTYKEAGAAAVMVAEPSSAMISPDMMEEFANPYLQRIIAAVQDKSFSVIYHNCGSVTEHLQVIAKLDADGFHFGSDVDLEQALSLISTEKLVLGNLEPRLFLGENAAEITERAAVLAGQFGSRENWRLSTGCDLSPSASPACLQAFFSRN